MDEDPSDVQVYRWIAEEFRRNGESFLVQMGREKSRDRALYDFALARPLRVAAFPRLYPQTGEDHCRLISKGCSPLERVSASSTASSARRWHVRCAAILARAVDPYPIPWRETLKTEPSGRPS